MTIRVDERDPFVAIFGLLHETGHALYDQGLAEAHGQAAIGTAPGMALHESQARLWENQIGRSPAFWRWQLPKLKERFPDALRICFATTPPDRIAVGVERLARAVDRLGTT